ncbi:MAG: hypothetical protein JNM99_09015 [Verrucomicrobiaceae bacterium]|nr:hypothetical protein [Verrucomicrobiaceae bacterium]
MPDDPYTHVLDRDGVPAEASQLKQQLNLIEQVINYGTQLMPRAWDSSQKGISDSIIIFHLFRKVITHLDSIHILLSQGAVAGAMSELRAMLEASVLVDWLLKEDTEQRAHFMFVAAFRRKKAVADSFIPGSATHQQLVDDLGSAGLAEHVAGAQVKSAAIDKMGQHPVFGAIYQLFDQAATAKGKEPVWTDVYEAHRRIAAGNPPKSMKSLPKVQIRDIFDQVGRLRDYRRIYGHLSEEGHGSALMSSLEIDGGTRFQVPNIRDWTKFPQVFRFSVAFALRTYRSILDRYRPGEARDNFPRKYKAEWQQVFMTPVEITKKPTFKKV